VQPTEHNANTASMSKTGLFATLHGLPHISGSGASSILHPQGTDVPSHRRLSVVLATPLLVLLAALALAPGAAFATGDANVSACPNKATTGFSASLPDCRAYELVTPAFTDGSELELKELSEDGNTAFAESLAGLAGIESDTEFGGNYQLSRTSAGWTVAPLSPPASLFPAQTLLAASPDLSTSLWIARHPSESVAAQNLYVRESDGAMVEVGPMFPPAALLGPPAGEYEQFSHGGEVQYSDASADLSHVLYAIKHPSENGLAWPGDTSKSKESLYEYSGTGNAEPELVGVTGGHGSHDLISQCSTSLGSFLAQDIYNAVSADGSTVYFTVEAASGCGASEGPEVNEVYARLDQTQTVPISEPTTLECSECNTSVRSSADFAGASQDGSKAFFLTEQELLPGTTAAGVNLYEYDFDGRPEHHVIAVSASSEPADVQGVARVSEDGSHVYFIARGRLGEGARGGGQVGGEEGPCLTELTPTERALEQEAQEQEETAQPVTTGARCRPVQGADNLYVFERDAAYPAGRVSFLATLSPTDKRDWSSEDLRRVQATPDGRFLVFQSAADLTEPGVDTSTQPQIFEYGAQSGELVRVSRGSNDDRPAGTQSAGEHGSELPVQSYSVVTSPSQPDTGLVVSADGSTVAFETQGALTSEAEVTSTPKTGNAYEYRSSVAAGGSISDGDVYLMSGSDAVLSRGLEGLDPSGQDLFVVSAASFVPAHSNTQFATYDDRVDGGFLEPDPPADCVAEACATALYAPPPAVTPVSTNVGASGNAGPLTAFPSTSTSKPKSSSKPAKKSRTSKCKKIRSRTSRLACEKRARAMKSNSDRGTGR
jgi:hypothetical protein